MDHKDPNGLTRRENKRKVGGVLDTLITVDGRPSSIRSEGRGALNPFHTYGYTIVKVIKEVMEDFELDFFQQRLLFDELEWIFECSECNVGQTVLKYVVENGFEINVSHDKIELKSVGYCTDCLRRSAP